MVSNLGLGLTSAKSENDLLYAVDQLRLTASRQQPDARKTDMGQFFTPAPVARLMASMLDYEGSDIHILDAGAGIGSLFASCVAHLCLEENRPETIKVTAFELDGELTPYLKRTFELCQLECDRVGIGFSYELYQGDFVKLAVELLRGSLFSQHVWGTFDCAIVNPPYKKIQADSQIRRLLRLAGIETSNIYTGFLSLIMRLLKPSGEMVAITPRSFCNGPYFKSFRKDFLRTMTLRRIHIFESRELAFRDDEVLQENIICHATKGPRVFPNVAISESAGPDDEMLSVREVPYHDVVRPGDPGAFIRLIPDGSAQQVAEIVSNFRCSLTDLGLGVSTGRVVDFRVREFLRAKAESGTSPLIFPAHFDGGFVAWPNDASRKSNAIVDNEYTRSQLIPNENYVLVRRFSAKEERRRVVASVYDARRVDAQRVGFENHLNYFHHRGGGIDFTLAKGLAAFLNSTLIDLYFRQFNGHTQVNAADLQSMQYPPLTQLMSLGSRIHERFPEQDELDRMVTEELLDMADHPQGDPVQAKKRLDETLGVLKALGMPRAQQNERSALTLLALLDLRPDTPWSKADNPTRGIHGMLAFFSEHYGKNYAENTRETVRRQTVHQFLQAGLVVANPDDPERPVNSPNVVYQIENDALELLRTVGTEAWEHGLRAYLASIETLSEHYAQERLMVRTPIQMAPGMTITLSPGPHSVLTKHIIEDFGPRFAPGARALYVGDTGQKFAHFDMAGFAALGVELDSHGKMPDVVLHHAEKDWLVLVEAVTSHGPVNPKRRDELKALFRGSSAGLVFVTAFLTRKALVEYLSEISWETEVWVAESPSHLIHFDGTRFLGPY